MLIIKRICEISKLPWVFVVTAAGKYWSHWRAENIATTVERNNVCKLIHYMYTVDMIIISRCFHNSGTI